MRQLAGRSRHQLEGLFRALVFPLLLAGSLTGASKGQAFIGVKETEVTGNRIALSDVLKVSGTSSRIVDQLNTTYLCSAPQPGRTKILAGADVLRALESLGLASERSLVEIPTEIHVNRRAQKLTSADLEQLLIDKFLPTLSYRNIRLERLELAENILLPVGETTISFECPMRTDLARPFYLTVNFSSEGGVVKRVFVRMVLDIQETVAVAVTDLASSSPVQLEDLRWELHRLPSTLHKAVKSPEFFEDKRPRTAIPAGRVLTEDLFVPVPLIQRGKTITLVYQSGKIRVTALGKTQSAGIRGERIQVVNLDSKRSLVAEVIDQSTARVVF